jgi:alpha(1,3/1,4) fucosyltransferase
MRVGVLCHIEYSVFSSGLTNTSLAIAELFKGLGYSVTLLNLRGTRAWWEDCLALQKVYPIINLVDISGSSCEKFDIVFEIAQLTLSATMRSQIANKSVWVLRKPFVLNEIEYTIYPLMPSQRDLSGVSEAWLLTDVTAPDDIFALETISRLKVRTVPFVWTPILGEAQIRSIGSPKWRGNPDAPFFIRIADTNQSSASSSTIPLVIIREMTRQKLPLDGWALHNGEQIVKSKFFRENVLKHCSESDLSGQCVGRQRSVDWVREENVVVLVNLRFSGIRPILLDLAWAGVPVIHNSPVLRDLGHGAERFYYTDNSIEEGAHALETLVSDLKGASGWFSSAQARREKILRTWSPISQFVRMGWLQALKDVVGMKMLTDKIVATEEPTQTVSTIQEPPSDKSEFVVVFSDMWTDFQADYNFFTLLLNEAGKTMTPPRKVIGIAESNYTGTEPDLVIFGPFGVKWERFTKSPKISYTGENLRPLTDPSINLNIGFDHIDMKLTSSYMRIPLWMLSINWFAADVERLVNPKPIPLECCTRTYEDTLESRKKFCAFVVSNPSNPVRNMSFHYLNQYKEVDSAGNLYNNIGDELSAGPGGGGGEWKKTRFFGDYKFALTYENKSHRGYCTEKYLHAKAAGAIPIYWGDPDAQRDFDMAGAIDAREFKTPDDLISAVKAIDTDDALWKKKASVPALNEYAVQRTRRTLSELAKQVWTLLKADEDSVKAIPKFLGAETGSVEARHGVEYFDRSIQTPTPQTPEVPLAVTYASWKFLGSLQHWLVSLNAQCAALPTLKALVFVDPDIPEETRLKLEEKYSFATFEQIDTSSTPEEFPDFWEPSHYAWKIWIYHTLVNRAELKDKMILYLDAGAVLCRWPVQWMFNAQLNGICCLEDPRENNDRWCGPTFCDILKVTDEEREQKQITAGLLCFRAGHQTAVKFFGEAYQLAQVRDVLVGPRISGVDTNGKSYGHRQDQSILSILVRRHNIPLYPLDLVYGDRSMRKTFEAGQSIYVHRGNFQRHLPFLHGIDDAYVINLDRRADRMEKFLTTHADLSGVVERWTATDGKTLVLTPELAKLFGPNDFYWKKAVMGCAMSHLGLWWKLVNDNPEIQNYLIFEDDAKMVPGWKETLQLSLAHVPENYDILYLGGILPPNRQGFDKLLEPVTKYYSKIKAHQFFGQAQPTRYFHSCAYAYIISRQGAQKVIETIQERSGYWTSADHMLCNRCESMNLYFMTPTIAGCYQDDDPNYANSDFNNFSRVDKFDSDLWNNDERFSREEIGSNLSKLEAEPFVNTDLLRSVFKKKSLAPVAEKVEEPRVPPPVQGITITQNLSVISTPFVCLKQQNLDFSKLYECKWLFSLFGNLQNVTIEHVDLSSAIPTNCPIFILQRPYVIESMKILLHWAKFGAKFKLLHLSDEGNTDLTRDPLIIYKFPNCIQILRTYIRNDFPDGTEDKIKVVPLGFRWSFLNASQNPLLRTPNTPFRENHWCFFGTDWNNRSTLLKPLLDAQFIKSCKFFPNWNDPDSLSREDYIMEMTNSVFVPCPDGINPETFRFYEALEAGCIPLVVKTEKNAAWLNWVSNYIPIMANDSWEDAVRIMYTLLSKPERLEIYRSQILNGWWKWTQDLKREAQSWLLMKS